MGEVPTGVVTFLFTDVVGSTRLWSEHHAEMETDLVVHDGVVRAAIGDRDGYLCSTGGDAFVAAFTRPGDAIDAAIRAQRELGAADWSLPDGLYIDAKEKLPHRRIADRDYFENLASSDLQCPDHFADLEIDRGNHYRLQLTGVGSTVV